jgi:taurine dioxygenase
MSNESQNLQVQRLAGRIGALLTGIDTSRDLSRKTVAQIREALLANKVIFLRDQNLTYESQVAFASNFGEVTPGHPIFSAPEGKPMVREFDSRTGIRANHWHSDLTFLDAPPAFAFLRSVTTPPVGGDTMWANGAAAYASMPESLKTFAKSLRIVHSNDCDYIDATIGDNKANYIATAFEAEHSAVQIHHETGEPYLLVGGFARRVVGFDPQASRDILRLLQEYAVRPENTIRWTWRPGDLAIWDNLATQHYAVYDYGAEYRRNERITVAGRVPVGCDGRAAISLRAASR